MRKVLAVGVAWLAMCGSAQAWKEREFTATTQPQTFVFTIHPRDHVATYFTLDGKVFLSGGTCRGFAHDGPIRAKEDACDSHHLVVRYRSTDAPTKLLYRFKVWR